MINGLLGEARAAGLDAISLHGLRLLAGGASKESWAFDLTLADGAELALVLRRQSPGRRFSGQGLGTVADEAQIMRFAGKVGVPIPSIAFVLPPASTIGDGFVMGRVAGETLGNRVLKLPQLAGARAGMARQCGEILARLHRATGYAQLPLRAQGAADALEALAQRYLDTAQNRPVFDYALAWLREHLPPEHGRVLLHGDFRTGNLVIGPEGIRAVLDWELAHVGPPASDLAWLCVPSWRFQRPELPVGGFGTREELLRGYEAAGGTPPGRCELHAWEVFQGLNWGVMCAGAGRAFMDGHRSVEGAVIARRASETEFDLMQMLAPRHSAWQDMRRDR